MSENINGDWMSCNRRFAIGYRVSDSWDYFLFGNSKP